MDSLSEYKSRRLNSRRELKVLPNKSILYSRLIVVESNILITEILSRKNASQYFKKRSDVQSQSNRARIVA